MKLFLTEKLIDNTQFKINQESEDEFEILAHHQGNTIAKLNLDIMISMFSYFEGDFTEEEYDQLFPEDQGTFISWLEVYDDMFKSAGIGRRLMNMAIEKSKQLGFSRIYLNASPIKSELSLGLNDLVNFYKSFGFQVIKNQGHNVQMLLALDNLNETKTLIKNKLRKMLNENERELGKSLAQQFSTPYITIYRAAPMPITEFMDKDYVTLSKKFAIEHAENNHVHHEEPYHVIQALVSTQNVFDAYNPSEFFYSGPNKTGKEIYVSLGPDHYEGYED